MHETKEKELPFWQKSITLDIGIILVFLICVVAAFPALFTHFNPATQDPNSLLQAPSGGHLFGTDNFGRDIFTRVIYGTRVDLEIGVLATIVPFAVGSLVGILAGYYGKWIDTILMRVLDIIMAFPFTILIIAIVAIMGPGIKNLYIAIWLVGWIQYARLVRSETMVVKNAEYIQAAKTLGYSDLRIILRHIFPNVISGAIIYGVSDIMMCMLAGASMSFLGLGVQPPTPEWGAIISDGRSFISSAWWICTFPGIALAITGVSLSLLGEGLSDLIRAKSH